MLLRPGPAGLECLLTRRPATMAFGPDIHVFPGGRVEAADAAPEALESAGLTAELAAANLGLGLGLDDGMTPAAAVAHHVAAVRETAEETGIDVAARDLISLTRWVTPISLARRFDVRFFAVFVPPSTEIRGASTEVADALWLTPAAALSAAASGTLAVWQPTFVTLQQLEGLDSEEAVRAAFEVGHEPGAPRFAAVRPGAVRVDQPWAGGIPGRRATGWLVGERQIVVVNPADPTGVTTEAIRAEVASRGGRLAGVVISGLHPDQHAGVEMLAHGLGLPVAAPAGSVPWAPYPVIDVRSAGAMPFGDPGLSLADVLSLG